MATICEWSFQLYQRSERCNGESQCTKQNGKLVSLDLFLQFTCWRINSAKTMLQTMLQNQCYRSSIQLLSFLDQWFTKEKLGNHAMPWQHLALPARKKSGWEKCTPFLICSRSATMLRKLRIKKRVACRYGVIMHDGWMLGEYERSL